MIAGLLVAALLLAAGAALIVWWANDQVGHRLPDRPSTDASDLLLEPGPGLSPETVLDGQTPILAAGQMPVAYRASRVYANAVQLRCVASSG